MTEEEIDVLGDFTLDNLLCKSDTGIQSCYDNSALVSQSSELLQCDYTIHPQWFLDNTSANPACWYSNGSNELSSGFNDDNLLLITNETQICVESSAVVDQTGWSKQEKQLLERGIEIFGKSSVRLSQFVGTKTPTEVKHYLRHHYCDIAEEGVVMCDDNQVIIDEIDVLTSYETDTNSRSVLKRNYVNKQHADNKKKVKFRVNTSLKRQTIETKQSHSVPSTSNGSQACVIEIVTGNGLSLPMSSGEEVIKIKKATSSNEESDSDIEIEIEDKITQQKTEKIQPQQQQDEAPTTIQSRSSPKQEEKSNDKVFCVLTSLERPKQELLLRNDEITELEKQIHSEFFEGRPTKTPARYLKIRNHIINAWLNLKPNYVTKTSIRIGLKNCGDVNCIGRIHSYLEQMGVINFGCQQTEYVRPLHTIMMASGGGGGAQAKPTISANKMPRVKSVKYVNDGEGGYTLAHDENGDVIKSTVVNQEEPKKGKVHRKPIVKLIYCRRFNETVRAPFSVTISFSALLQMDLHAHSSLTEVMGLVGGLWDPYARSLTIDRYEPCRNAAGSSTHCDMCPISQAHAVEMLHSDGVQVLGWFHSHPTFAPEPSQQDLDTQLSLQEWLSNSSASWQPFVGVILSPYSLLGALIASPYRCLIVESENQEKSVPYKFNITISTSAFDVEELKMRTSKIWRFVQEQDDFSSVDFSKSYFLDKSLTFMEKFINSVKMNLAKYTDINKMTCDSVIEAFDGVLCCKTV